MKYIKHFITLGFVLFIFNPVSLAYAADEIDAYCSVPKEAVPHGSTVPLTIKFSDSDKSNDVIVQGPFSVLKYDKDGKPIIVDFKRGNDKDDTGKENVEKPTLTFNVILSPTHSLPAPATETVTFTYYVKYKDGKRGQLYTTNREKGVDCSFTVQHEIEKNVTPSEAKSTSVLGDPDFDLLRIQQSIESDLGVSDVGTLPTSPFYFLKEWKRGISRMFTWNALSRVELELRITNEKAAELIMVEETKPTNTKIRTQAIGNFSDATERLESRLVKLKDTSENPKVKDLLAKFDAQSLIHATLLSQLAERYHDDPYVEDAAGNNIGDPDFDLLRTAIRNAQDKNTHASVIAVEKNTDVKQKAEEQIARAEEAIKEFKSAWEEYARLNVTVPKQTQGSTFGEKVNAGKITVDEHGVEPAGFAIKEQGVRGVEIAIDEPGVQKTGPIRIDNTPARISTNMTIERQTPKRDFGDRMKAGLDAAGGMLASAKTAFSEGKYGEAFGHARSAEVMARGDLRLIAAYDKNDDSAKNTNPLHEDGTNVGTNPLHEERDDAVIKPTPKPTVLKPCISISGAPDKCGDATEQGSIDAHNPSIVVTPPVSKPTEPIACTQEAKLCPDGSSVGRTGPRCEFAECPQTKPVEGVMCTAQYDPVCGADGKTYGNSCVAGVAGVSVVSKGECGASVNAAVSTELRSTN